jgi:hypothetical protein
VPNSLSRVNQVVVLNQIVVGKAIKYLIKTSTSSLCQVKESPIGQRYRLLLLNRYLMNIEEVPVVTGGSKWIFCCPFCSSLTRTDAKRNERKGGLLWNGFQNSWAFFCARQGSAECSGRGKALEKFLSTLDTGLAEQYRMERWHSGTTGRGHNCGVPKEMVRVSTEHQGSSN